MVRPMGSGQPITDPFLALMRSIFWGDGLPTVQDGTFAVTWALEHAIEVNPGGSATFTQCRMGGPGTLQRGAFPIEQPTEKLSIVAQSVAADCRRQVQGQYCLVSDARDRIAEMRT